MGSPETNDQITSTRFSIAVNEKYRDKQGELQEKVVFMFGAVFGGGARFLYENCRSGDNILVEGGMSQYTDKNDQIRYSLRANHIRLIQKAQKNQDAEKKNEPPRGEQRSSPPPNYNQQSEGHNPPPVEPTEDDIPI